MNKQSSISFNPKTETIKKNINTVYSEHLYHTTVPKESGLCLILSESKADIITCGHNTFKCSFSAITVEYY